MHSVFRNGAVCKGDGCCNLTLNPIDFPFYLQIQIGCQTDDLHRKDELKRPPRVHERFPVTSEMMHVSNLWGGLIYLVAPPNTQVKGLEIIVQKAVTVPYYKSGKSVVYNSAVYFMSMELMEDI